MSAADDGAISELSVVALRRSLAHEGRVLFEGSRGVVVHVYRHGEHYEVEFTEPFPCTVTVVHDDIEPMPV